MPISLVQRHCKPLQVSPCFMMDDCVPLTTKILNMHDKQTNVKLSNFSARAFYLHWRELLPFRSLGTFLREYSNLFCSIRNLKWNLTTLIGFKRTPSIRRSQIEGRVSSIVPILGSFPAAPQSCVKSFGCHTRCVFPPFLFATALRMLSRLFENFGSKLHENLKRLYCRFLVGFGGF